MRAARALLILPIALLVIATGAGGAASATTFSAQIGKPPPTIWAACPAVNRTAAEQKVVRTFERALGRTAKVVPMPAGTSALLCGNNDYGFYHIEVRHYADWTRKSIITNENWREVADYSIAEALRNPTAVSFRAATNTFCYSRQVSLVDKVRGVTVDVMYPNVVVRVKDGAIITAFPSGRPC